MTVVGSAEVIVRAITDKLKSDIQKALQDVVPEMNKAGAEHASTYSEGFNRNVKHLNIDDALHDVEGDVASAGDRSGRDFGSRAARAAADGFRRDSGDIERAADNIGGGAGRRFSQAFSSSSGGRRGGIGSLALRIAALIPIFGALIGAISNIVSGLFAIGAAAAHSIPSVVALGGALSALGQGLFATLGSFSGIGKALQAGMQTAVRSTGESHVKLQQQAKESAQAVARAAQDVADAEKKAARDIKDAQYGVQQARRNVRDTAISAAEAEENADRDLERAERSLADAHDQVREAQEALTQARIDAKQKIIDLQFASRSGALQEQRAILALQDARYQLNATNELPADNRTRIEAVLAYKEAKLNLDEIRDKNKQVAAEQKKAKKEGINGMPEVVAAQKRLADAQQAVRDAIQGVNDALRQQRDVQRQNTEAIADANHALKEAQQRLRDAYENAPRMIQDARDALVRAKDAQDQANASLKAGGTSGLAFQQALQNLSPAAREFVKYLLTLRDDLHALRDAGAETLFPRLQQAIQTLVKGLFPSLRKAMRETGAAVGDAAKEIANALTSKPFLASFGRVAKSNTTNIRLFGKALGNIARIIVTLLDAARPVTRMFFEWFAGWTKSTRKTLEAKNALGGPKGLTAYFKSTAKTMKQVIDIVKNISEGFYDFGKIASTSGGRLLKSFEKSTKAFADFTDTKKHRQELRTFFNNVEKGFRGISALVVAIGQEFFKLGADKSLGKLARGLIPVVHQLGELMKVLLDNTGGDIVGLLQDLGDVLIQLSKGPALKIFIGVFRAFFQTLDVALKTPVLRQLTEALLGLVAAMYAFKTIKAFPGIRQAGESIKFLANNIGILKPSNIAAWVRFNSVAVKDLGKSGVANLKRFGGALRGVATSVGGGFKNFGSGIVSRIKSISNAIKSLNLAEKARIAVTKLSLKWGALQSKLEAGFQKLLKSGFVLRLKTIALKVKDTAVTIAKTVAQKASAAADKIAAAAAAIFNAVMNANPIFLVITAVVALVAAVVVLYKKWKWFHDLVNKIWHGIVDGAKWLWDQLFGHSIFPDIVDAMQAAWDTIGKIISFVWDDIIKPIFTAMSIVAHRVVIPVVKLLAKIFELYFKLMGKAVQLYWKLFIHPVFIAIKTVLTKVVIPVIKFLYDKVVKPIFKAIGTAIQFAWKHVIQPIFKLWVAYFKQILIPVIQFLWNKVVKPIFGWIGDRIRGVWRNVIKPVFKALADFIGDVLVPAFQRGINKIGDIWDSLKRLAAKPVNFIIDTVYNKGIRGLVNKVLGFFGVDKRLPKIPTVNWGQSSSGSRAPQAVRNSGQVRTVNAATGGILPGYTPGRDVHHFVSPTAGRLNLSGGEAIMRPEFTRAVGPTNVAAMNRAARLGGTDAVRRFFREGQGFASGGIFKDPDAPVTINGKRVSRIAAAQLALAKKLSGINFVIMQGGYGGSHIAASGTSHNYPGVVDAGPGSILLEKWLRKTGFAAWARNIPGRMRVGSGAHVHAVSLLDPGDARSPQVYGSWAHHGNGLSGYNNDPAPHYPWVPGLRERLGAQDLRILGGGDSGGFNPFSWLKKKVLGGLTHVIDFVEGMVDKIPGADSGFGQMVAAIPKGIAESAKDYITRLLGGGKDNNISLNGNKSVQSSIRVGKAMAAAAGWTGAQWNDLNRLWTKESGWRWWADNPDSTAYGIPQAKPGSKMASVGRDWRTNPITQIKWGLGYIGDRYGSPSKAWGHEMRYNWYDGGGIARGEDAWIPKRVAKPERVLSPEQTKAFERLVAILDRDGARGGGDTINLDVHVPQQASARDVVDGLVYELKRMKRGGRYA